MTDSKLRIGDVSDNGQITIVDEDRLCYLVKSVSKGAYGLRTISKALLKEFTDYMKSHPDAKADEARNALSGSSDIDKFEYGYASSLVTMAKMQLDAIKKSEAQTEVLIHNDKANHKAETHIDKNKPLSFYNHYVTYITAIKSKPFLLLAGISGTGKSRIVRELARACWDKGTQEYEAQKPKNSEMIQVRPNWHDSSELIGYVSRLGGEPRFVAGDFLKFIAKAWMDENTPYFLCLDEMNLAPVEQYFAEYLSVIETRKRDEDGNVVTDPILKKSDEDWYRVLTAELTIGNEYVRNRFFKDGITIPQNLIVIGTVNMDETTFSFSRKVLDRAMTIEMNEVNLYGGLTDRHENIGKLEREHLIGTAVEGVDVYSGNKEVCDKVLEYLTAVNGVLERTPFKVAYRTRNEFLLYVVNNLPYNKDENGNDLDEDYIIARALDEITSMKILSRIEGDEMKIGNLLTDMRNTISEQLNALSGRTWTGHEDEGKEHSVSLAKLTEMEKRLRGGYTSFWS